MDHLGMFILMDIVKVSAQVKMRKVTKTCTDFVFTISGN